jgi:isopropylmalate/homocitrate/citramalate synthase
MAQRPPARQEEMMNVQPNQIWTSSLNDMEIVQKGFDRTKTVRFYDTTLRDGEQSTGVAFSASEKFEIAVKLAELGIGRIESGFPRVSEDDTKAVERILAANLKSEIWGFARAVQADIDAHLELGTRYTLIEITTSDMKMAAFGFTREKVKGKVIDAVKYAKDKGIARVNFFAVDSTRSDLGYLREIYSAALEAGADEISVVDTIGACAPEAVEYLIKEVRSWVGKDVPIHWHGHNDFGLATASAIAAVKGGADWIQGTINGMGERAGNADICEVALALKFLYNMPVEIDLSKAREVSNLVQKYGKYTVDSWKPVVGKYIFTRESGGVASQFHMPSAIEPYSADILGADRHVALGKKAGLANIKIKLAELGLNASDDKHAALLERVKALGTSEKRLVTDDEFRAMVAEIR